MCFKKRQPHVRGHDPNTRMCNRPGMQLRDMRPNNQLIKPIRRQIKLGICGQRVRTLEYPVIPILNGYSTMATRMPEKRDGVKALRYQLPDLHKIFLTEFIRWYSDIDVVNLPDTIYFFQHRVKLACKTIFIRNDPVHSRDHPLR